MFQLELFSARLSGKPYFVFRSASYFCQKKIIFLWSAFIFWENFFIFFFTGLLHTFAENEFFSQQKKYFSRKFLKLLLFFSRIFFTFQFFFSKMFQISFFFSRIYQNYQIEILLTFENMKILHKKIEFFTKKRKKVALFLKKSWKNGLFFHNSTWKLWFDLQKSKFFQFLFRNHLHKKVLIFDDFW